MTLFSTILIVCGKVNFTNLSRYSELNEKTYRRQFSEEVDFGRLNGGLIQAAIPPSHEQLAVMDSSFLRKSGKATFGLDRYWNGCHSWVERGLEVSLVSLVEVETEVSYALHAQQTFAQTEMAGVGRMDQYLGHLTLVRPQLPATVQYLAVDGADAKERFVTGAVQFTGLCDCQARDLLKLDFHFNASFTALNLAKFDAHHQHQGQEPFVFSMASAKRRALNQHLLERFIANLDLEPSVIKSHPNYSTLCDYGTIAA